jgi:hypothetical protein
MDRPRVLFVGAFPRPGGAVVGGMVTSCGILLESSFPTRLYLDLMDSTQISNPPPGFAVRLLRAAGRFAKFTGRLERHRPDVVLLFVAVGASIVAYIPNDAYLVRASAGVASQLRADPQTQTVLPYEPYYKLKPSLLALAVDQTPLPENTMLNVLVFADAHDSVLGDLQQMGVQVLAEERSPFGPVLKVQPPVNSLAAIAGLAGVHLF